MAAAALCGYHKAMFAGLKRFLIAEIDFRALVHAGTAAIALAVAAILAIVGRFSRYRDDFEIATSILVLGVLVYGIFAALNAEAPDRE